MEDKEFEDIPIRRHNIYNVREFHYAMKQPINVVHCDTKEGKDLFTLRLMLIQEEYKEMMEALLNLNSTVIRGNNIPAYKEAKANVLKEIQDLKYVLEGFCVTYGMDSIEAEKRVHESNMSKLIFDETTGEAKMYKNEEGKVMKGPDYQPPNLMDLTNDGSETYGQGKIQEFEPDTATQHDNGSEDTTVGDNGEADHA